ncbi:MAG: DUF2946 family protein [Candidatus Methylomirabilia bacterium]
MSRPTSRQWLLPKLRIDPDGEWFTEGEEITHAGILAYLRGNLRHDGEGYFVQAGPVRVPVEVEDTPFAVVRVESEGNALRLTVNDQSQELLDPATLRLAPGGVPYCRIKVGQFEARFTRAAAHQLGQFIHYDEGSNRATLTLGGARYQLTPGG